MQLSFDRLLRFLFPEWRTAPTARPPTVIELALVIAGCILVAVGAVICFAWQEAPGDPKEPLKAFSTGQWANMLLSNGLVTAAILFIGLPQGQAALAALPNDRNLRAAIFPAIVVFCWVYLCVICVRLLKM